jgi:hypothetical protein
VHIGHNHFDGEVAEAEHEHPGETASNHEGRVEETGCVLNPG